MRESMMLRLVETMSGPDIARCTGMVPGTVRMNLHRGMQILVERPDDTPSDRCVSYLWDPEATPDDEIAAIESRLVPVRHDSVPAVRVRAALIIGVVLVAIGGVAWWLLR